MKKIIILLALVLTTSASYAWHNNCHEGIVILAVEHLNPEAKSAVEKYLGQSYNDDIKYLYKLEKAGKAKIDMGGMTMWAPLADLEPGAAEAAKPKGTVTTRVSRPISYLRLDLRGKRADLALAELEQFLDRSLLSGTEGVEIVHGRGTGALRKAVHELLRTFPGVASYSLAPEDQGGDGMTQVLFR